MHGVACSTIVRAVARGEIHPIDPTARRYRFTHTEAERWQPNPRGRRPVFAQRWRTGLTLPESWRSRLREVARDGETPSHTLRRLLRPHLSPF